LNHLTVRDVPAAEGSFAEPPRGTSRQAGFIRVGALTVRGEAVQTTAAGGDDDRPEHAQQPGQRRLRHQQSRPGHRTRPDTRRRTPSGHLRRPRVTRSQQPASARACPARLACDPTNPCTRRTHMEGLSCPDPSAVCASHCQHH
jgi:hypothetical protein